MQQKKNYFFESICKFVDDGSFVEYEREANNGKLKYRFEYQSGAVNQRIWIEDYDQSGNDFWNEVE